MQSKCGTSCEGGDKDSPIRFQRVETGKNRQSALRKGYSKICTAKTFFRPPKLGAKSPPMTIILQIVQTLSPVFFKSLRRCSRELEPVGDLVNLGFSYRRVFIGKKVIGDLGNRGLGPVGELGLGLQSGTWACRGIGFIGDLVIGEFCYRGLGQSGAWAIGDLGYRGVGIRFTIGDLGLSGSWVYRGFCYRGVFIGEKVIGDLGYRANVVLPKYHTFEGYYICSFSKLRHKVHQKVRKCSLTSGRITKKISKGAHTIVNANEAMPLITGGSRTSESGGQIFSEIFLRLFRGVSENTQFFP